MKLILLSLFLVPVFLSVGCAGNSKHDRISKTDEAENPQNDSISCEEQEDFYGFLQKFSTKRNFQLKRIVFPITVSIPDSKKITLTPSDEKIEKTGWELLDLTYDSTYATRDYDKYTQTVSFWKDTAHVSLRGVDNGIYADYYFKLIEGKWYLVTLVE